MRRHMEGHIRALVCLLWFVRAFHAVFINVRANDVFECDYVRCLFVVLHPNVVNDLIEVHSVDCSIFSLQH